MHPLSVSSPTEGAFYDTIRDTFQDDRTHPREGPTVVGSTKVVTSTRQTDLDQSP
jgi:hypothetical protein